MITYEKNFSHLLVKYNQKIKDALKVIEKGERRLCFVVDKNNKILKVISDGDIRRSLIQGKKLTTNVLQVHKRNPIFLKKKELKKINNTLPYGVDIVPIVNSKMQIVAIGYKNANLDIFDIKSKKILVLGLGYVGLTLGLKLAENGFKVTGLEKNKKTANLIKNKKPTFYEKDIDQYLNKYVNRGLNIYSDPSKIKNIRPEVFIITVGTPIDKKTKKPNLNHVINAVLDIKNLIKKGDLIIFRSTVPVGFTRKTIVPILEKFTRLKVGINLYVAVCPERTAEGKALKELDFLPQIVGANDDISKELASRLFNINTPTVVSVDNTDCAEMCKILDNTYRDTIFSFSNEMAIFCEKSDLDVRKLIDAVNLGYARNFIPYPSPGVGGPCLSKDPYILMNNFREKNLKSNVIKSARIVNEMAPKNILKVIEDFVRDQNLTKNVKIFAIGLAFKGFPETSDTRDSTSVHILDKVKKKFKNVYAYDFLVEKREIIRLGYKYSSIDNGIRNSNIILILNNHGSIEKINFLRKISKINKPCLIYDSWRMLNEREIAKNPKLFYRSVGL